MKPIFLILFMFPAIIFAQPKIEDIVWVGKNKELLLIFKKEAGLIKGSHAQEFKVVRYVKNSHIILSSQHITGYLEQKYNFVRFTQDTLILAPVGRDVFKLSQLNEDNQYVFVSSLVGFTFVKLHFSTSIVSTSLDVDLHITLDIDSTRKSRVKIHDDYMNETNVVTTSMSKREYQSLIQILSAIDSSALAEKFSHTEQPITQFEARLMRIFPGIVFYGKQSNVECSNSVFEISYNEHVQKCNGCAIVPFYDSVLEDFLWRYISSKSYQSGRNPKILY